jgi:hypothetical protein
MAALNPFGSRTSTYRAREKQKRDAINSGTVAQLG